MLTASNKQFNVLRATNVLKQLHILCHVMQGSTKIGMAKHNANLAQPLHILNLQANHNVQQSAMAAFIVSRDLKLVDLMMELLVKFAKQGLFA